MRGGNLHTLAVYILLALVPAACLSPYYPETGPYEQILVVDGMVSDEEFPVEVRLSRAFSYATFDEEPEEGAAVVILDDRGSFFALEERAAGVYTTGEDWHAGIPGRAYQLRLILQDGTEYASDFVKLRPAPQVDPLEVAYEEKAGSHDHAARGLQLYLNTSDSSNSTRYYRWEWEESWEFTVPMKAPEKAHLYRCWMQDQSRTILLGTSEQLSEDRIIRFPLHFVDDASNRLRILYSLEVRQYAISRLAYEFWKLQEESTELTGTLFDPIPGAIPGNIYNTSDPGEPVLGLFEACGVSRQRIFLDPDLLPPQLSLPTGFEHCRFQVLQDPSDNQLGQMYTAGWILVDEYQEMNHRMVRLTNHVACYDCTRTGSNVRPNFWPSHEK